MSATWDGTSRDAVPRRQEHRSAARAAPVRPTTIPDGTATFGGYRGSCDLLFTGDIDQVMLFDKVLPIEQIWDRFGFILNKPTLG